MSDDLETLLARMPLCRPPASLDERVLAAARRPRRRILLWALTGGASAAAAAVLIALALPRDTPDTGAPAATPPAPVQVVENAPPPVRLERNWARVSYEGIVTPDDRTPMMKFRRHSLEHVQWLDDAHDTQMEMTVPREDVILIRAPVD